MNYTKKMYLVPKELFKLIEEKQHQHVAPLTKTIGTLDREMEQHLSRSDLPSDTQLKLFDQQSQRWHAYREKDQQPLPITLTAPSPAPTPEPSSESIKEQVLTTIPKAFQSKAKWLLQRMEKSDGVGWNDKGELVLDGASVEGSHMVDLVNDMLRKRKSAPHPVGWEHFATEIAGPTSRKGQEAQSQIQRLHQRRQRRQKRREGRRQNTKDHPSGKPTTRKGIKGGRGQDTRTHFERENFTMGCLPQPEVEVSDFCKRIRCFFACCGGGITVVDGSVSPKRVSRPKKPGCLRRLRSHFPCFKKRRQDVYTQTDFELAKTPGSVHPAQTSEAQISQEEDHGELHG